MRTLLYTFILMSILIGCKKNTVKNTPPISPEISHLGAWEMIYFHSIQGQDTTELHMDDNPLAITLLTSTHFAYHWKNSANSAAGTYRYDGKIIHQTFEYVDNPNFVGATLSFAMTVRNDSLIFEGPVSAVSNSGDKLMDQIPQMLEIRRRVK